MKPTLKHLTAADGSRLVVTTRVDRDGCLRVHVFRNDDKRGVAICSGAITAASPEIASDAEMRAYLAACEKASYRGLEVAEAF